jgi:hypothetical protein
MGLLLKTRQGIEGIKASFLAPRKTSLLDPRVSPPIIDEDPAVVKLRLKYDLQRLSTGSFTPNLAGGSSDTLHNTLLELCKHLG